MNIRQLEIFNNVAATGSITKAASKMFLSQPAVSKAIRELEESVGIQLFDRIDHRLHLNNAGRAFRIRATQLLTDYSALANFGSVQTGQLPLRVGTSLTFGQNVLPAAITKFRQQYPDVPLQLFAENVQQIKQRLLDGDIDVAFVEGFASGKSFRTERLSEYELMPVAAPDFTDDLQLTRRQLPDLPFLLREKGSTLRDHFDERMHELGLEVEPMLESVNTQVLIAAARAGLGVTILPAPIARPELTSGALVQMRLPGKKLATTNYAITLASAELTQVERDLINCFREAGTDAGD
ncbi:LysR family transcriptional regulator [Lacticaseibacillus hulanensis]|uniref:LysR family transcriptional regulator n=1 Tax=Lacticaseibacillus hulanensis TaxID=2493111 RepID=UPI000FDA86E2|nr:LysR family transcriptional regulator [Lacticaseibacillus hulanensis]